MSSGKRIPWVEYDHLLISHLPTMTIEEFTATYLPDSSSNAVGARARKLGVKPTKYRITEQHKEKLAKSMTKIGEGEIEKIRELRDTHSGDEIAAIIGIDKSTVNRMIAKYKIPLSKSGQQRARTASNTGCVGKAPWNKGITLPDAMKVNMAIGRQKMSGRLSALQASFYRILDECEIEYCKDNDPRCRFGHWTFDCRIIHAGQDFLVEVQGGYIHSLPKNLSKDKAKATYMERYFPEVPIKYIWEHEFGAINRVKQIVSKWVGLCAPIQQDFQFNDVNIRPIDESTSSAFLTTFHYLGKLSGKIKLGAYLDGVLVAVSIWSAPTRIESAIRLDSSTTNCLELRRFVIHDEYHKRNFASWLLSKMEKTIPKSISVLVSFADSGVGHNGTIYKAANWISDGFTEPSFFYVDNDGYVMLKKTLYNSAKKMHMNEAEFAETFSYKKVQTPPKLRFIKYR